MSDQDEKLGFAWRRCVAALPKGWSLIVEYRPPRYCVVRVWTHEDGDGFGRPGLTFADALDSITEALLTPQPPQNAPHGPGQPETDSEQ